MQATQQALVLSEIPYGNGKGHNVVKSFKNEISIDGKFVTIHQQYASIEKEYYRDVCRTLLLSSLIGMERSFIQDWDMWHVKIVFRWEQNHIFAFSTEDEAVKWNNKIMELLSPHMS